MKFKRSVTGGKLYWLERAFFPCYIGFTMDPKAWAAESPLAGQGGTAP